MKFVSLESFRGIAAVLVAVMHSPFYYGDEFPLVARAEMMVDFFFVLSGFVLAMAYQKKIAEGFSFVEFILLRFGRVYPLHLFMLLLFVPYIGIKIYVYYAMGIGKTDPLEHNNLWTFLSNLLLIHSLGIGQGASWNEPSWSISVEFYTYIVFFVYVFLLGGRLRFATSLVASLAAYGCLYWLADSTLIKAHDLGMLRCLGGFFMGVFVYDLFSVTRQNLSVLMLSLLEVAAVSLSVILILASPGSKLVELFAFISFGLVVYVFAIQADGVVSKLLCLKPFVFVGKLSYSIYMTHLLFWGVMSNIWHYVIKGPVRTFVAANGETVSRIDTPYALAINVGLLMLALLVSYFTYHYIETPWRDRFRVIAKRFARSGAQQ